MYSPKHSYENVSDDKIEYHPMRALADRDQTLIDTAVTINYGSLDRDLGYFVTKRSDGNPCANDIHY